MQMLFGIDEPAWAQRRAVKPVTLNTEQLINGHMLFCGMSGTGKSFQLLQLMNAAHRQGVHVDAFDIAEELHVAEGAFACKFSEATQLGYNPLVPSLDIHSGGIRRQIEFVVDIISRTSRQLGPRQVSALKNLLSEVYTLRGMYPDKPATWDKRIISEAEFDELIGSRRYDDLRKCQPILRDVISYCERKLKAIKIGSDNRALAALERVEKSTAKINAIITKKTKAVTDEELAGLHTALEKERADAIESYANFINAMDTGREYADAIRYSNEETLKSVLERLQQLQESGIFKSQPPDWGDATTRVYQIASLKDDERKLLVYLRAEAILRMAMDAGKTDSLRHLMVIDEGHLYASEDTSNPLNQISLTGRKYGLGLVMVSPSPTHFSEDFLTNAGTIVMCGIHSSYWPMAAKKLQCDHSVLVGIRAREVAAIKLQKLGEADPRFVAVNVNRDVIANAVKVLREQVRVQQQTAQGVTA